MPCAAATARAAGRTIRSHVERFGQVLVKTQSAPD